MKKASKYKHTRGAQINSIFSIYFQLRAFIFILNNTSYMFFLPYIIATKVTLSQQSGSDL
jgi:hypothetical protein